MVNSYTVLLIEQADAVEDGFALSAVGAVNQMAHDTLLVNHDGQRKSLPLYPWHHVTSLDEVGPGEVVLLDRKSVV